MKFNRFVAAGLALAALTTTASAETYMREGTQEVEVRQEAGLLYCTRVEDGYEMCNGMAEQADGTWKGKKMKHPDMPGFMRFNGTVTFYADGLTIKGCALGICDSETWKK